MASSTTTRQLIRETVRQHGDDAKPNRQRRLRRTGKAISLLLLFAGLLLWWGGFFAPPAAVIELRTLVDEEVSRLAKVARNEIPYDGSRTDMGDLFQKIRDVPEPYRDQARRQMGRLFSAREGAAVGSYFALPPNQRRAELDRRIKADESRRQQWAAERATRAVSDRQRNPAAAAAGSNRPQQNAAAAGGPGGWGRTRTEEARNERMKSRLDASSPEQRARRTEYRRAVNERREQLGLAPGRGGPGRRPG